jgi:hypothetical protein
VRIALVLVLLACSCSKSASVSVKADADGVDATGDQGGGDYPQGGWDEPTDTPSGQPRVLAEGTPTPGALATMPGFRLMRDGSSSVYVEVLGRVPVQQSRTQQRMVIHLPGVKVPEKVNKMDLPTTHFKNTPVGRVVLVQRNEDADLVIELRAPSPSRTRVNQSDSGTVVRIDFPRFGGSNEGSPTKRDDAATSY